MGKDNVPFHTVIFPSTLMGTGALHGVNDEAVAWRDVVVSRTRTRTRTGEPWTLLHHLSTTEYLQYETGKFSKSRNTGVFGDDAMRSGASVIRVSHSLRTWLKSRSFFCDPNYLSLFSHRFVMALLYCVVLCRVP
jgi:hypothetical protein